MVAFSVTLKSGEFLRSCPASELARICPSVCVCVWDMCVGRGGSGVNFTPIMKLKHY